jgi:spore coat protein H
MKKVLLLFTLLLSLFIVSCTGSTLSTGMLSTTTNHTSSSTNSTTSTNQTTTTWDGQPTTTTSLPTGTTEVNYDSLFDNTNYKKFTLYFSRANFDKLINDMQNYNDQFGSYRDNTIQQVDMVYEDGHGNVFTMNEVGFRTKGNIFSRRLPVVLSDQGELLGYQQVSFQLEFNEAFDYPVNSTQYKALRARRAFGLEQLNFKYIRDNDTSAVTELAAYDYFRSVGIVAPNTSLAIIYFDIDGEVIPYGLFTVIEPIDDVFVRRYFGRNQDGSIGDLYKCVWQDPGPANLKNNLNSRKLGVSDYNDGYRKTYQLKTNKTTSNYSIFMSFVSQLNNKTVPNYQNVLGNILDMDTWLKTLAMSFLLGNPDDYRSDANNYYLYFYERQAIYIPFDYDQSMGFGWNPYGDYGISLNVWDYPPAQGALGSSKDLPLVYNILEIPSFRLTYENYLLEFTNPVNGVFNTTIFEIASYYAQLLYQGEILSNQHLGLQTISLVNRYMSISDYFTQKTISTRNQILSKK